MNIEQEVLRCTECEICLDVCPTYKSTGELLFSPLHRLKTAMAISRGEKPDPHQVESIYNCPKCMKCDMICPQEIKITDIVHQTREELVQKGYGPLSRHNDVIQGIIDSGNSVGGDPAKRLDWLPEEFTVRESDTLLYMGCLPSYLVKDAAAATYLVLKKLGVDFMILKDEGCCGTYMYEAGRTDIAKDFFQKNVERFKSIGIKNIIVPCNGCLKCFKYFYPKLLGETGFTVHHAVEIILGKLKENSSSLHPISRTITYQDSCRLSRGEGIIEEPRELLKMCGADIKDPEPNINGENAPCCGAGAGIRSVYRDLSMQIATDLLAGLPADKIVSACPFCTFNMNYTSIKKQLGKDIQYFSKFVLDALD
jgi:Fe-S oxidoreductase